MKNVYNRDYCSHVYSENKQNICTLSLDVLGRIMTFLVLKEITNFDSAIMNLNHRVSFLAAIKYQRVYLGKVKTDFEITIGYILRRNLFVLDLGNLRDRAIYSTGEVPLTPLFWAISNIQEAVFNDDGDMKLLDMLTSGDKEYINIDTNELGT